MCLKHYPIQLRLTASDRLITVAYGWGKVQRQLIRFAVREVAGWAGSLTASYCTQDLTVTVLITLYFIYAE